MRSSINLVLFIYLLLLFFNPKSMHPLLLSSSSETTSFELRSLPHGYLTFLGDSHLLPSAIALTKENMSTTVARSAGVVLYNHPILLLDPHSKTVPSFYTMFAFSIRNLDEDEDASGDGLAFLISPDDHLLGSPGYLGLVDSTDKTRKKFIAIEFDTKCDSKFHDPDDNHVGLDINGLFSVKVAKSSSLSMNLKSGDLIRTWINYKSDEKRLEVFLSSSYRKPTKPLLTVDINLSDYLKDNMFVGFSAATEGSMQFTHIEQWEFAIVEYSPPPPPPSSPELGSSFANPSEHGRSHNHLSRFEIGLTIGVCSVPFVIVFGWFFWKKFPRMSQELEGKNNLEMQVIRASGSISYQELLFSILVDEVGIDLNIDKVLGDQVELIRVETVKSSVPLCSSLPGVKSSVLPPCNGLPLRTDHIA